MLNLTVPSHLFLTQPIQIAHHAPKYLAVLSHSDGEASSQFMAAGPMVSTAVQASRTKNDMSVSFRFLG